MEHEYSVYEAKARFSEILRRVAAEEEVIITHRGRRVARIVPFEAEEDETLDERIERFVRRGSLHPAAHPSKTLSAGPSPSPGALERFLSSRS